LDEYGAEDRSRFSGSIVLAGMVLAHRLSEFEFESLAGLLDHFQRGAPIRRHDRPSSWHARNENRIRRLIEAYYKLFVDQLTENLGTILVQPFRKYLMLK